jgi:hypothetical protein
MSLSNEQREITRTFILREIAKFLQANQEKMTVAFREEFGFDPELQETRHQGLPHVSKLSPQSEPDSSGTSAASDDKPEPDGATEVS